MTIRLSVASLLLFFHPLIVFVIPSSTPVSIASIAVHLNRYLKSIYYVNFYSDRIENSAKLHDLIVEVQLKTIAVAISMALETRRLLDILCKFLFRRDRKLRQTSRSNSRSTVKDHSSRNIHGTRNSSSSRLIFELQKNPSKSLNKRKMLQNVDLVIE